MNKKEREKVYKKMIKEWGEDAQIRMLFEEMAELQVEICHFLRNNRKKKTTKKDIASELADVEILLEQMKMIFKIPEQEMKEIKNKKLLKVVNYL